jgi:thiamine biosynthesis lipoprotein
MTARSCTVLAESTWKALGTTVVLRMTELREMTLAVALCERELEAIDRSCSRFRSDSDLERVNASAGAWVTVGPLLLEAVEVALRAAALSDGLVDPTLGGAMELAGYSRDWATLTHPDDQTTETTETTGRKPTVSVRRAYDWQSVELRPAESTLRIPAGVRLDLGATAKALAADRAARAIHAATGSGVLLSLGGDIAVAGRAPAGGWAIRVTDDHRSDAAAPGQTVAVSHGAIATSSTTVRRWLKDEAVMHHILDPATGMPVAGPWRTVSVAAATCVDANIASTAAIVRGPCAPTWLSEQRLPARFVSHAGSVTLVAGWPPACADDTRERLTA